MMGVKEPSLSTSEYVVCVWDDEAKSCNLKFVVPQNITNNSF